MLHRSFVVGVASCAASLLFFAGMAHASIGLPDNESCNNGSYCLQITNNGEEGVAIVGVANDGEMGVQGASDNGFGVYGYSSSNMAVYGLSSSGSGVYGTTGSADLFGLYGENLSTSGYNGAAVYGNSDFSLITWAGRFDGDVWGNDFYGNDFNGAAFITSSDRRLKKDIKDSTLGLNEVLKFRPVTYRWKNRSSDHVEIGFIAQEMRTVIPDAVVTRSRDQTLGINYIALVPVMAKAIQDQQKLIDAQAARIARLEQHRSNALAAMVSDNPLVSALLLLAVGAGLGTRRRRQPQVDSAQ